MYTMRPLAMEAFHSCRGDKSLRGGWSIEYHIQIDGSRSLARHALALDSLRRPRAPHADVRALVVTIVRNPFSWYRSQWVNPSGTVYARLRTAVIDPASTRRGRTRANLTRFVLALGPAWQYRDLLEASDKDGLWSQKLRAMNATLPRLPDFGYHPELHPSLVGSQRVAYEASDEAIAALVGFFDVVGVTERLNETLLVVCHRIGLAACPVLGSRNAENEVKPAVRSDLQREWDAAFPSQAPLERLIGSTDSRLHSEASRRLEGALREAAVASPRCHRRYLAFHRRARPPAAAPCGTAYRWDGVFANGTRSRLGYTQGSLRKCGLELNPNRPRGGPDLDGEAATGPC